MKSCSLFTTEDNISRCAGCLHTTLPKFGLALIEGLQNVGPDGLSEIGERLGIGSFVVPGLNRGDCGDAGSQQEGRYQGCDSHGSDLLLAIDGCWGAWEGIVWAAGT